MKRLMLLTLFLAPLAIAQRPPPPKPSLAGAAESVTQSPLAKFDFQSVNVAQVVQLIYAEALKQPYVIDPEVLTDSRSVSFRYESARGDMQAFIAAFFDSLGLTIQQRAGVDFVTKKKLEEKRDADKEVFVYRPKYRDVAYITRLLSPLLSGAFTVNRTVRSPEPVRTDRPIPEGSALSLIDQSSDILIYSGTEKEIAMLKNLLPQIDERVGEVMVRGVVYEVSSSDKDGSAFTLALNLLSGKLSLANGTANPLDNFIKFKNQTIDAVYSALSVDSRFKVVSTPSLRVRSGGSGRFTVGQDVPVLGAVTYPGNGQAPVQSVEYRSSGVIFDLLPQVRDAVVDLNVSQQVSNFVATATGVNSSPTLIKREVKTVLTLADGDVVVLGGLAENKESQGSNGLSFVPGFFRSKNTETSKSEILLILQLTKI
jgi:general secretion pathway protein D